MSKVTSKSLTALAAMATVSAATGEVMSAAAEGSTITGDGSGDALPDIAQPAAALPTLIQATEADPEPAPPAGGSWLRLADGSLQPRDEATARGAGLAWPA